MIKLTDEQKDQILEIFEENQDLNKITKIIGNDKSLDGRCELGRAIRAFLASQGKEYNARGTSKKGFDLTQAQKQFLMSDKINCEMSAIEITRLCFKDESIKPLTYQHRAVMDYLKRYRPEVLDDSAVLADGRWHEPKSLDRVVSKINKWCHTKIPFEVSKMNVRQKRCVEELYNYLRIYSFIFNINSYNTQSDRDLFESEFIRATWDKPDLTSEELTLYMQLCSLQVRVTHLRRRSASYNAMLEGEDLENTETTEKLIKQGKILNDDVNSCEKAIENLISDLNGKRSDRIKELTNANNSMITLVEEFQSKEGRHRIALIAEMQNKLEEDEANRLETMSELKCRIMGSSPDELI